MSSPAASAVASWANALGAIPKAKPLEINAAFIKLGLKFFMCVYPGSRLKWKPRYRLTTCSQMLHLCSSCRDSIVTPSDASMSCIRIQ